MDPASTCTSKHNKMNAEGRNISVQLFRFAMLVLVTCRDVSCSATENAHVELLRLIPLEEPTRCVSRPGLWMDIPGQESHTGWLRPSMSLQLVSCGIASPKQLPLFSAGCYRTLPINRSLSSLVPQSVQLLLPHRDSITGPSRSQLLRLILVPSTHRLRLQPLAKQMFSLQTASASPAFLRDNPQLTVAGTGNPFALPADPRPFLSAPKRSQRCSAQQHSSARLCSGILRLLPHPGPTFSWRRWTKQPSQGLINQLACISENCRYFSCLPALLHVWSGIAAFPSCHNCTVVCRSQRLHHAAGGERSCPECSSSNHPRHRLEVTSPGANPLSTVAHFQTHCRAAQVFNRLEVSSPGPYSLSHEADSESFDLPQVTTPLARCLPFYGRGPGCVSSCDDPSRSACWLAVAVPDTAHYLTPAAATTSQIWFRHCLLLHSSRRPWPSVPRMANRPPDPQLRLDQLSGRPHRAPTPRVKTVPRNMFIFPSLRLRAQPRLPATHRRHQHRRLLRPPRWSPIRCSRPRQPSHHTRSLAPRRRTQQVSCLAPMFRHPVRGLTCSWGGEAGGVHVYFPPYTITPASPFIAGYEYTFTLAATAIRPKAAVPKATPPRPPRRTD